MMTSTERIWITPQAHSRLHAQLAELRRLRDSIVSPVARSGRDEARVARAALHNRVQRLHELLRCAVVGETPPDDGVAEPGMVLTVRYDATGDTETFLLAVREAEDGAMEAYSMHSPLGSAILGARPGQSRTYRVPSGATVRVTLLNAVPYGLHGPNSKIVDDDVFVSDRHAQAFSRGAGGIDPVPTTRPGRYSHDGARLEIAQTSTSRGTGEPAEMAVHSADPQAGTVSTLRPQRWKRFQPLAEAAVMTRRRDDDPELACQLVDVAIRLYDRFSRDISFAEILTVIDTCRRDLDIATHASLPELVDRLAAQRLLDTITRGPFPRNWEKPLSNGTRMVLENPVDVDLRTAAGEVLRAQKREPTEDRQRER